MSDMKQQYTVVEMDPDFVKYNSEYEQYALIYCKEMQYGKLYGC